MKYQDIKGLSQEELAGKISEEQGRLQKLKFAHAVSPIENPMSIRTCKRAIAQMKTAQRAAQNTDDNA